MAGMPDWWIYYGSHWTLLDNVGLACLALWAGFKIVRAGQAAHRALRRKPAEEN